MRQKILSVEQRERLRRRYRPSRVRMLFIGESPPASGVFFYQANSGLYRAVRSTFFRALPHLPEDDFLNSFRDLGCYLVDLCGEPVDRLDLAHRRQACRAGEVRLSRILKQLQPEVVVSLVRSIESNVDRAQELAGWQGETVRVPYPGRWKRNREEFQKILTPELLRMFSKPTRAGG